MTGIAGLLGNLQIWTSLPFFLVYYLFYTGFDNQNPEGRVKDTTVRRDVYVSTLFLRAYGNVLQAASYIQRCDASLFVL